MPSMAEHGPNGKCCRRGRGVLVVHQDAVRMHVSNVNGALKPSQRASWLLGWLNYRCARACRSHFGWHTLRCSLVWRSACAPRYVEEERQHCMQQTLAFRTSPRTHESIGAPMIVDACLTVS